MTGCIAVVGIFIQADGGDFADIAASNGEFQDTLAGQSIAQVDLLPRIAVQVEAIAIINDSRSAADILAGHITADRIGIEVDHFRPCAFPDHHIAEDG